MPVCQHCPQHLPCSQHTVGPWKLKGLLTYRESTHLYTVEGGWVMKLAPRYGRIGEEQKYVKQISEAALPHCMEFPLENRTGFYGEESTHAWYVMRHYSAHVSRTESSLSEVARACLTFLKELHRGLGLVYLDWRFDNLYRDSGGQIRIGDFEFCASPLASTERLRDEEPDCAWYFIQRGGEADQPLMSYRMDLESLGFLLASMEHARYPDWWLDCDTYRRHEEELDAELVDTICGQRDAYRLTVEHTGLRLFFQRIQECPWDSEAMPAEWYDELIGLFAV